MSIKQAASEAGQDAVKNPSVKKYVAWGVGIVVGVVVLGFVANKFIKWFKSIQPIKDKETVDRYKQEVDKNNRSYSESQYLGWADSLYGAMRGRGTTEESIYSILGKMKTIDDWRQLNIAFGVRGEEGYWSGDIRGNLTSWLQSELDEDEQKIANGILKKVGASI